MTNATFTRTVTADLPDYASTTIKFTLLTEFPIAANGEIFSRKPYVMTLDANGLGSIDLPCADNTGETSWNWYATWGLTADQASITASFNLAYSEDSIALGTLATS